MSVVKKKRSELWNFFTVIDSEFASCDICKQKLSYKTTTSNFRKHMSRKHPTVQLPNPAKTYITTTKESFPEENERRKRQENEGIRHIEATTSSLSIPSTSRQAVGLVPPSTSTSIPVITVSRPAPSVVRPTTQSSVAQYLPQKINACSKKKIDSSLMLLFTQDMQPFSIVEDTGFRQFVHSLNPAYNLPSRHTISKTMLPQLYEKCRLAVQNSIANVDSFCITTDCWTTSNNDSMMAVTAHYISDDFELKSALLQCTAMHQSHTSDNLADELRKTLVTWGLEKKVRLAISDNASNIKKAIKDVLKLHFFGCLAHKINIVVSGALKGVWDPLIINIKTIVSHFKRSTAANEKLMTYQRNSGLEPKKLIQDVPTRWNSTYLMLVRFCDLQEAVKATQALLDTSGLPVLSQEDWKVAQELVVVLKPFFEATKSLSGDKYPTASVVIVITRGLIDVLGRLKKMSFSEPVEKVIQELDRKVHEKMGNVENDSLFLVAMFLDPRFKSCFKDNVLAERVRLMVVNSIANKLKTQLEKEPCNHQEASSTENDIVSVDSLSIWNSLDECLSKAPKVNPTSKGHVEVRRYLDEGSLDRKKDPLLWWRENHFNYPNLSKVVKDHLCCLASSVPCERLFSKGGYILNERRSRLSIDKVRKIMFVNTNIGFL